MSDANPETHDDTLSEIVTFTISGQAYCFDIGNVLEIRGWTETTTLPHAPEYVMGMMNLRGNVLSVVDLSLRLGLGATQPTSRHVIIIASVDGKSVGFLVDGVSDILTVDQGDLQSTPDVSSARTAAFLRGVYSVDDSIVREIDLHQILRSAEQAAA